MHLVSPGRIIVKAAAASIVFAFGMLPGLAQIRTSQVAEYSVKFLCGHADEKTPSVRPGTYATSVNLHNPRLPLPNVDASIKFYGKVVLSLPTGQEPQKPSPILPGTLKADFAEEGNCNNIRKNLGISDSRFIEGWVVLYVYSNVLPPLELDVSGVYTVESGNGSVSLEIVPATPRIIKVPLTFKMENIK